MFLNQTRLQHLLRPRHDYDPNHDALELERLFQPSWQFACSRQEIRNDGDFFTKERFGTPILVRNFGGIIKAFENVFPQRHAMLTCDDRGNCPVLKCQYHGWEFTADGRTGKIPEAKAFRPWDRENAQLHSVRLETCGDLLLVTLSDRTPSLSEWLDPL